MRTWKGGGIDADGRVVGEDQQADGGGAGEGVLLDAADLIVGQIEIGHVVQSGEGELRQTLQRGVLQR